MISVQINQYNIIAFKCKKNEQLNTTTWRIALTEVVHYIKRQFNFKIQTDARKRTRNQPPKQKQIPKTN